MTRAWTRILPALFVVVIAAGCGKGSDDVDANNCIADDGACTGASDCCSGLCRQDVCVPTGGCTAAGDPCASSVECCGGHQCRIPTGGTTMVCVAGLCEAENAPCTLNSDCCSLDCTTGGTCGTGTPCLVKNTTCGGDDECCSNICSGTCQDTGQPCDSIGEACTDGNSCCTDFCADAGGEACGAGDTGCRCALVTNCRPQGELCTDDNQCCNDYCDRPDGPTSVGTCAAVGGCGVVGEPCGNPGITSACCSNACLDSSGSGVATCQFLGGCKPISEVCSDGAECCSGTCTASGTTADGRDIMRCTNPDPCLDPGEVCFTAASANCCPAGGGSFGCQAANSGVNRCFGGENCAVLPGNACTSTDECCKDQYPTIMCVNNVNGQQVCCLQDGESCDFGDVCCGGVCTQNTAGEFVCGACKATGAGCTADADCCDGCCADDGTGNLTCTTNCGCTLGQLGDSCTDTAPCCPGLICDPSDPEFRFCILQ